MTDYYSTMELLRSKYTICKLLREKYCARYSLAQLIDKHNYPQKLIEFLGYDEANGYSLEAVVDCIDHENNCWARDAFNLLDLQGRVILAAELTVVETAILSDMTLLDMEHIREGDN